MSTAKGYNRIKMCDNNPLKSREKRDVEGSDELTHEDLAVLMTPFNSNEHHREKRSVVSKDNATRYCAERLLETKVGKLCAALGTNVQALVNVCSADIQVSCYRCFYLVDIGENDLYITTGNSNITLKYLSELCHIFRKTNVAHIIIHLLNFKNLKSKMKTMESFLWTFDMFNRA